MGVSVLRVHSPEILDLLFKSWPAGVIVRAPRFDSVKNEYILVIEGPSVPQCEEVEMLIETAQGSADEFHQVKNIIIRPVTPHNTVAGDEWFDVVEVTRFEVVKRFSTTTEVERLDRQYPNRDIASAVAAALNEHILEKHHG